MTWLSSAAWMTIALGLAVMTPAAPAQPAPRFKAVAFDYFVIFDANSIVPEVEKAFPGKSAEFTKLWRAKQWRCTGGSKGRSIQRPDGPCRRSVKRSQRRTSSMTLSAPIAKR